MAANQKEKKETRGMEKKMTRTVRQLSQSDNLFMCTDLICVALMYAVWIGGESTDSLGEIMSSAFSKVRRGNVTALVELVQSAGVERFCVLRSGKNNLTVPHG